MSSQSLLQQMINLTLVALLLTACGAPAGAPTPIPPTATPPSTGPGIDREGLVAYWPFDGDANDASGNGHHGTVHGATLTTDRYGEDERAYAFDGVDDFISVSDSPDFDIGAGEMTVLLWIFHQAGNKWKGIVSHTDGLKATDGWMWTLDHLRGGVVVVCMDGIDHLFRPLPPLDTWVHLAFVKKGSMITSYVDGVAQGNPIDHRKSINDSDGELRIGMEGSTWGENFFLGKIDDVRLYNRALTADEILAAMNTLEP